MQEGECARETDDAWGGNQSFEVWVVAEVVPICGSADSFFQFFMIFYLMT